MSYQTYELQKMVYQRRAQASSVSVEFSENHHVWIDEKLQPTQGMGFVDKSTVFQK